MNKHVYKAHLCLKDDSEVEAKNFSFEHEDYDLDDSVALKRVRDEEGLELGEEHVSLGSAMVPRSDYKGVRVELIQKGPA